MATDSENIEDVEDSTTEKRRKGRGHGRDAMDTDVAGRYSGQGGVFESLAGDSAGGPLKSVEGWIVFVTSVHEEAQEEDLKDRFAEYGPIKNIELPLDRRTGFVKGYALIEYEKEEQAKKAIDNLNGDDFRGQPLGVAWAFHAGPNRGKSASNRLGRR